MLHRVHRRNLHHAQAQRGQQRRGRIARAIQVRQAVPQGRGQAETHAVQRGLQQRQQARGQPQEHQQRARQPKAEDAANLPRLGHPRRQQHQAAENHDECPDLHARAAHPAQKSLRKRIVGGLHRAPEDQNGAHAADVQQGGQAEQQRRQHTGGQP